MAEVLVILAIAAEVAEDVKIIAEALHAVVDLANALSGKKDHSAEKMKAQMEQMKREIITFIDEDDVRKQIVIVHSVADYWFGRLLPKVAADRLSKASIDGPLELVMDALDANISSLTSVFNFFEIQPQPTKPDHPRVLSSLLLCNLLLSNLLMIERLAYFATGGTAQDPTTSDSLNNALAVTSKWINEYKGSRSGLIKMAEIWMNDLGQEVDQPRPGEPEVDNPPFPTGTWNIYHDGAVGDSVLENLEGRKREPDSSVGIAQSSLPIAAVTSFWTATQVGGVAVPNFINDIIGLV